MGIDIRANVTCSLGTLISANVSDDYIQGSGLIKTRGSCEISGLVSPTPGTVVTFNYTKSGVTRAVPRKLRVLSSFADPFRRTTKVELGCKLTYLQDLKDRLSWDAFDDPLTAEEGLTEEDAEIITIPISAQSVALQCILALGLSVSGLFLTNTFSIAKFDFSPSYVQVLSDLLVSESYCGYLDYTERLVIFPLYTSAATGPSINANKLIDIGPINVGDLPGDTVTVAFTSLRLKASVEPEALEDSENLPEPFAETPSDPDNPDDPGNIEIDERNWEYSETIGALTYIALKIPDNKLLQATYTPRTITRNTYTTINGVEQLALTTETSFSISGADYGNYLVGLLNAGAPVSVNAAVPTVSTTITSYTYTTNGSIATRDEYIPAAAAFGAMNLPYAISSSDFVIVSDTPVLVRRTISTTESVGSVTRNTQVFYKLWHETIQGQQAIAEGNVNFQTAGDVAAYANSVLTTGPVYAGTETTISATGQRFSARPSSADRINQDAADTTAIEDTEADVTEDEFIPDYTTPGLAELVLATGSSISTRRIELSMPYAPDDKFTRGRKLATDPDRYEYFAVRSDARSKASLFGRVQNRLLFGNRYGMNIQTIPELLPNAPYGTFYVTANGVVTQYRTNGTSWTMDSNGIVASTDALYWGVVGRTA